LVLNQTDFTATRVPGGPEAGQALAFRRPSVTAVTVAKHSNQARANELYLSALYGGLLGSGFRRKPLEAAPAAVGTLRFIRMASAYLPWLRRCGRSTSEGSTQAATALACLRH
jgi:hypothetical protein